MSIITENQEVELSNIKQLYPAAIVKTGYQDETTQVSLEWLETESKGQVELVEFAIFLELKDTSKYSFSYSTREELFEGIGKIQQQINS